MLIIKDSDLQSTGNSSRKNEIKTIFSLQVCVGASPAALLMSSGLIWVSGNYRKSGYSGYCYC